VGLARAAHPTHGPAPRRPGLGGGVAADGRHLASAGEDGTVRVWDWRARRTPPTVLRHTASVRGVAFAADGRHLASAGGDGTVRVWDWRARRTPPTVLRGHADSVAEVAFAADGLRLASAGDDRTVRMWDWRAPRTPAHRPARPHRLSRLGRIRRRWAPPGERRRRRDGARVGLSALR
jgi:WD40 repeat protein